MSVKLDWQFDEEEFEEPDERPVAGVAGARTAMAPELGPRELEANAILLHIWLWNSFSDANPGQLYLVAALLLFGALILLCLLV